MQLTELIGNTPLVDVSFLLRDKPKVELLAKLEGDNPGSSVKDRAAWWMIKNAEARGDLKPGMKLLEPTSGNTGIALAMIAATRGYEIDLVMPANATPERVGAMKAYGANVILTPADQSMEGAIDEAHRRAATGEYFLLNQFGNPDNWAAHYESTGPEIWRDTDGRVTHFVSAMGTTGTIMGTSRFLKEQSDAVSIVGCQPTDGSRIPGIRRWPPEYLPKIYDPARVDRIVDVDQQDAEQTARRMAREAGLFCGISSGGACWAALSVAEQLDEGVVVFIVCDRGDRYLSHPMFAGEAERKEGAAS
jgi:cysteine synthase B